MFGCRSSFCYNSITSECFSCYIILVRRTSCCSAVIKQTRTGRTAGIKARKLEQQGVAGTAESARNILVGGGVGGKRAGFQSDLTFLKNAMGDGVHFSIEKGGSARANLLSQQPLNPQRKKRKLLDAAATRLGTTVTLLEQN